MNSSQSLLDRFPVIFMDEFSKDQSASIKLLRNLARVMIIPSVLSSTNSIISNMTESSSTSSTEDGTVWVHVVRKLMKANVAAVLETIGIRNYLINGDSNNIEALLEELNIKYNEETLLKLKKLVIFLFDQSKSNLQGTCAFTFRTLYKELCKQGEQGNQNVTYLDPVQIWNSMCIELIGIFRGRKAIAFNSKNHFYGLRMFSVNQNHLVAKTSMNQSLLTEQDVTDSIDHHFYYFGRNTPESVYSFGLDPEKGTLRLGRVAYESASYYSLLEDDFFTTIALWSFELNHYSVAYIVKENRRRIGANMFVNDNALSNDFRIQESMTYWAVGVSSHESLIGKNKAVDFLSFLIGHVQVDEIVTVFQQTLIFTKLAEFLKDFEVPYLIPKESVKLESQLKGICRLGVCTRTANQDGIDMTFDIYHNEDKMKALIECKYTDDSTNATVLEEYLSKAERKQSPLTLLICFRLDKSLKLKNALILRKPNAFKINVYSVFNGQMIPLIEHKRCAINGVFIIIESNFQVNPYLE